MTFYTDLFALVETKAETFDGTLADIGINAPYLAGLTRLLKIRNAIIRGGTSVTFYSDLLNSVETQIESEYTAVLADLGEGQPYSLSLETLLEIRALLADPSGIADGSITTAKYADASVTPAKLSQPFTSGNPVSVSGTQIDFTNIPSWVKQIDIPISGLSTNGTSSILIQLGDSGGIENTGYLSATLAGSSAVGTANATIAFSLLITPTIASTLHGTVSLRLVNASTNTWNCVWIGAGSDSAFMIFAAGSKSLSATLDRVRLTTTSGDTLDAGSLRINYYG